MQQLLAWVEFPSGERLTVSHIFSLGRTPGNNAIIPSERVSRRHAVIRQTGEAFELMDMGSSNGTFLNGVRLSRPASLRDGDIIEIGLQKIIFRRPPSALAPVVDVETIEEPCWLLTIEAATLGMRSPSEDAIGKTVEGWSERCQRIIRKHRGLLLRGINEGLLACWRTSQREGNAGTAAAVLRALSSVQTQTEEFRFTLHHGAVTLRRGAADEWKPSGNEVIFTLQLQRLVSAFDTSVLITEPAHALLQATLPLRPLTAAEMRTYRGSQRFFTLKTDTSAG